MVTYVRFMDKILNFPRRLCRGVPIVGKFENLGFHVKNRCMITRGNHCVYDAHYHIVFPVKYRKALLNPNITQAIIETAQEINERYEIDFEKIGTDINHIHLLASFHPKNTAVATL